MTSHTGSQQITFGARTSRPWAAQRRLEMIWAWASLLALLLCWDATIRLDEHVSLPRPRLAHALELECTGQTLDVTLR